METSSAGTLARDLPPLAGSAELAHVVAAIAEGAFQREQESRAPFDAFDIVRQSKLGAFRLPVAEGGSGASLPQLFALVVDLGTADPNTAQALRNHFAFVEMWLRSIDTPGRARWLAEVAKGVLVGMVGTELGPATLGSKQFSTTLVANEDAYVLNGVKYYSTGAMFSDWIAVTAAGETGEIETALVRATCDGVTFDDDWDGMGQRLTATGTTHLVDVRVELDELMSDAVRTSPQSTFFQLWLTAVIAGIMQSVVEDATAVLHRRNRTFGHASGGEPIDDPLLQEVVGRIASEAYVARSSVLAAAELLEPVADPALSGLEEDNARLAAALAAAKVKVVVDEMATRAATALFDVGGASATRQIYNLDRHWRNIRTVASHNPAMYKARAIGDHLINGNPPPPSGFF